jgi:hypothetical protein
MTRSLIVSSLLAVVVAAPCKAQQSVPAGWKWQLDRPTPQAADTGSSFQQMPPGWHITTGKGGLLYAEGERADGHFSVVADFVVFPETTSSGFGLFLGGSGIGGGDGEYLAALLRRDGAVSVIRNVRGAETVLVPWTSHAAIRAHPGTGVVTNRLRVNASADSVRVFVNDSAVARIGLDGIPTAGHFGFRVGDGVNLHITILDHIRHIAPARSR